MPKSNDRFARLICLLLILTLAACAPVGMAKSISTPQQMPTLAVQTTTRTATSTVRPSPSRTRSPSPTASATATHLPGLVKYSAGPVTVPILLYHRISNQGNTRYIVPVAEFRAQMHILHEAGCQTITISQLARIMREGGSLPEKPVVITIDDGFVDIYKNAFPILQENDFQATLYIISGTLGTELSYGYLQENELKELVAAGWEIGSHSISHDNLEKSRIGIRTELRDSKKALEEKLGVEVLSFSYPYGITNNWIQARVEEYGYTSAVGIGMQVSHSPEHIYYLSRREVYRGTSPSDFRAIVESIE